MAVIIRWFDEFPRRSLELMRAIEPIASRIDRAETLCLLIAPALIAAPFERLQDHLKRKNPQSDYLRFAAAHDAFDAVMSSQFGNAPFWPNGEADAWRAGQVRSITGDPKKWTSLTGSRIRDAEFWTDDVRDWETRRVWKCLRDALAHWNIVTCNDELTDFSEDAKIERFVFYRSGDNRDPWDVITVGAPEFSRFLNAWAEFLATGMGSQALALTGEE